MFFSQGSERAGSPKEVKGMVINRSKKKLK